jgi:hypothetical protein
MAPLQQFRNKLLDTFIGIKIKRIPTEVPIEPHLPEFYKFTETIEKDRGNEEKNLS